MATYSIDMELTNLCENGCAFCPRWAMTRGLGMMEAEVFEGIVTSLRNSLALVTLSGMGDPLLHPRVFEFIECLNRLGIKNGIVINPATILAKGKGLKEELLSSRPGSLTISFPSVRKGVFEKLMPGVDFKEALSIALELAGLFRERGCGVRVSGLVTGINQDEAPHFRSFWMKKGIPSWVRECHSRGGHLMGLLPVSKGKGLRPDRCWLFENHWFVSWDGRVLACCHDLTGETSLGNVASVGLEGVLLEREARIRGRFPHFPLCNVCDEPLKDPPARIRRSFLRLVEKKRNRKGGELM